MTPAAAAAPIRKQNILHECGELCHFISNMIQDPQASSLYYKHDEHSQTQCDNVHYNLSVGDKGDMFIYIELRPGGGCAL